MGLTFEGEDMKSVINSPSKANAIESCEQFKRYFPYRFAAIVKMFGGSGWGYVTGKTMAKINTVAKAGCPVYLVK
jgi:hypothetical protein